MASFDMSSLPVEEKKQALRDIEKHLRQARVPNPPIAGAGIFAHFCQTRSTMPNGFYDIAMLDPSDISEILQSVGLNKRGEQEILAYCQAFKIGVSLDRSSRDDSALLRSSSGSNKSNSSGGNRRTTIHTSHPTKPGLKELPMEQFTGLLCAPEDCGLRELYLSFTNQDYITKYAETIGSVVKVPGIGGLCLMLSELTLPTLSPLTAEESPAVSQPVAHNSTNPLLDGPPEGFDEEGRRKSSPVPLPMMMPPASPYSALSMASLESSSKEEEVVMEMPEIRECAARYDTGTRQEARQFADSRVILCMFNLARRETFYWAYSLSRQLRRRGMAFLIVGYNQHRGPRQVRREELGMAALELACHFVELSSLDKHDRAVTMELAVRIAKAAKAGLGNSIFPEYRYLMNLPLTPRTRLAASPSFFKIVRLCLLIQIRTSQMSRDSITSAVDGEGVVLALNKHLWKRIISYLGIYDWVHLNMTRSEREQDEPDSAPPQPRGSFVALGQSVATALTRSSGWFKGRLSFTFGSSDTSDAADEAQRQQSSADFERFVSAARRRRAPSAATEDALNGDD